MLEVAGATIDDSLRPKVPAKFMHKLRELIDGAVPITDMDTLIGAA